MTGTRATPDGRTKRLPGHNGRLIVVMLGVATAGTVLVTLESNAPVGVPILGVVLWFVAAMAMASLLRGGMIAHWPWWIAIPLTQRNLNVLALSVRAMGMGAVTAAVFAMLYVGATDWFRTHVPLVDTAGDFGCWVVFAVVLSVACPYLIDAAMPGSFGDEA